MVINGAVMFLAEETGPEGVARVSNIGPLQRWLRKARKLQGLDGPWWPG